MKIISFVNFKGGVGKTTAAVNVAADLAYEHDMKVLLADVDPQANATFYLQDEEVYAHRRERRGTLENLIFSYARHEEKTDIKKLIIEDVFNYQQRKYNEILRERGSAETT